MNITPLGNNLLIEPIEVGERSTPAGLRIPQTGVTDKCFKYGRVLALGDGQLMADGSLAPIPFPQVGDIVSMLIFSVEKREVEFDHMGQTRDKVWLIPYNEIVFKVEEDEQPEGDG